MPPHMKKVWGLVPRLFSNYFYKYQQLSFIPVNLAIFIFITVIRFTSIFYLWIINRHLLRCKLTNILIPAISEKTVTFIIQIWTSCHISHPLSLYGFASIPALFNDAIFLSSLYRQIALKYPELFTNKFIFHAKCA